MIFEIAIIEALTSSIGTALGTCFIIISFFILLIFKYQIRLPFGIHLFIVAISILTSALAYILLGFELREINNRLLNITLLINAASAVLIISYLYKVFNKYKLSPKRNGIISIISTKQKQKLEDNVHQMEVLSAELAAQNRQLIDFANITSHNLRSPAASMTALIELHDMEKDPKEREILFEKIREVSSKLNETLNDLTQVVKVRKGYDNKKQDLKFTDILNSVKASIQAEIMNTNSSIVTDFQIDDIRYPKVYLESIFLNLLTNAIKYRRDDIAPYIKISTKGNREEIYFTFSDNGIGIDLKKHGQDFFGLNKTFHGNADARGLGLFITKNQIESLGGSISVESEPNKGTTFKITFNQEKV